MLIPWPCECNKWQFAPIVEGVFQSHAWDPAYAWIRLCVPFCDGAPDLGQTQARGELTCLIIWCHHESEKFFICGTGRKSGLKKENKLSHKKARHEGEWNQRQDTLKRKKPKQFQGSSFKPRKKFIKRGAHFKVGQPKGDGNGKPKGACFNCNEMKHYSEDCPKPKPRNGGSKVIALTTHLAQGECNRLIFLKEKVFKWILLCLLDTRAFHNFIIRKNVEKMEL
jgi:hypothetical protein